MRSVLIVAIAALAALPAALAAQKTGVIAGVVVDESGKPVADVDVIASGENARARSDSAGRFEIRDLDGGQYNVRTRRIGFYPTRTTADISRGGRADLHIEMRARPVILDSVVVMADGKCADRAFIGFYCRRRAGKGLFLTDDDIFDKNARELGDIFRDVPGFRIEMRSSIWGALPVPLATKGSRCLNALVNGRVPGPTNQLPNFADQVIGVEIYASPSDIPTEYQKYAWGSQGRQSSLYENHGGASDRCSLVVYWTQFG